MSTLYSYNQLDHSEERSSTQFYGVAATAINLTAENAKADAVRSAVAAISLCNEISLTAQHLIHNATPVAPASHFAQREMKLIVHFTDTVNGRKGTTSIPGPDLAALELDGDEVELDDSGIVAAFVAAFEDTLSRDLNPIVVNRIVVSGRNS